MTTEVVTLGLNQLDWVKFIAGFGGILLTFLAGAEVDLKVMREKAKESIVIGGLSFFAPFCGTMLFCRFFWGGSGSRPRSRGSR